MHFKKRNIINSMIWLLTTLLVCSGFRTFGSSRPWERLQSTPASQTKLFVVFDSGSQILENDLPSSDPLFGTPTITVAQAMQSIFNDYNNIQSAFVTLVDTSDADYSFANAEFRTITIQTGSASGLSSGEASLQSTDGEVSGCTITMTSGTFENATRFIGTMTHELGHCLGLDHPQEITQSVMSYFSPSDIYRLQGDDKMGIVVLYPVNDNLAKEEPTLGLSCSKK